MHFSSAALVLSTLAIGQVAAAANKHASFHARRQQNQPEQRDVPGKDDPFWKTAVDWDAVFKTVAATQQTPAAKPAVAEAKAVVTSAAAVSHAAPSSTAPAAAATSKASSGKTDVLNVASNLLSDAAKYLGSSGIKIGLNKNSQSDSPIWVGNDGSWTTTFTNKNSETSVVVCWAFDNYNGMSVGAYTPKITAPVPAGQSITLSFTDGLSGACSTWFSGIQLINSQIANPWFEFTFKNGGTFDVSKIPNMSGNKLAAVGKNSGCTSAENSCIYECINGANRCFEGNTYNITNPNVKGCGGGYDSGAQGQGGGCHTFVPSEHVDITVY